MNLWAVLLPHTLSHYIGNIFWTASKYVTNGEYGVRVLVSREDRFTVK